MNLWKMYIKSSNDFDPNRLYEEYLECFLRKDAEMVNDFEILTKKIVNGEWIPEGVLILSLVKEVQRLRELIYSIEKDLNND